MAAQTYQLVMRSGPNPGKAFALNKNEIYLGRDVTNDIVINDAEISRKHARLVLKTGGYILEDLGSTNGTFVDGQRLMGPHPLLSGETLMLGENVSLAYEAGRYDPDATMVSGGGEAEVYPSPAYPPRPPSANPPPEVHSPYRTVSPSYSGQIPPGPMDAPFQPPEEKRETRVWLLAGCGCLLVLGCILVAAGFAFDYLNLYCTPPFNTFFNCP